tara:strand:- start:121 stop:522 length:402 start_codon:yes stop_codon:yes gene_type:complete
MAKLTYLGTERRRSLIKRMSISKEETIDINPIHALTYLGDDDFKILFENSDKKALENCSRGQEKRLIDEFNCKTLDEVLDKMYPKPKTTVFKPKTPKVEKPVKKTTTVKPTKKEEKPQKVAVIPKKIDSATER